MHEDRDATPAMPALKKSLSDAFFPSTKKCQFPLYWVVGVSSYKADLSDKQKTKGALDHNLSQIDR